ncbi:hypothetical protein J1N35_035800 [Gossypium stocksii]|uniref:C2H2-type domain-containing protein n=1 Tax=Gossypium stocksii TaxID=47602 RepID=A0A9D3UUL3_9ROSI|nr:hypothetical protein J1N35_035800 [Gossypium stocksii]
MCYRVYNIINHQRVHIKRPQSLGKGGKGLAGENRSKRVDEHMIGKSTTKERPKPRTIVASVEHIGDTDGCTSNGFERALATDQRGHCVT